MKNIISLIIALLCVWAPILSAKPRVAEIVKKDVAGNVLYRGLVRMDAGGHARSYRVYKANGKHIKCVIVKYGTGEKIPRAVRAVVYGSSGDVEGYVVKTKGGFDALTPKGKLKKHYPVGAVDSFGIIDFCIKANMIDKN